MVKRISIISQQGALLEGLLDEIAASSFQDAQISLINAAVDCKTSSVLHKGRPLGFSFIDDYTFEEDDLVLILESDIVVSAYCDQLAAISCPVIGFYKDISSLKPMLYQGGTNSTSSVYGVLEPMVSALKMLLKGFTIEALDIKAMFSAELMGQAGITELASQTAKLLNSQPLEHHVFGKQLPFNFYPILGNPLSQHLQDSLVGQFELAFDISEIHLLPLQMPVFHGQTLLVSTILSDAVDLSNLLAQWDADERIALIKDPLSVSHLEIANVDANVMVGCYSISASDEHRLDFWVTIDENPFMISETLMPLSELLLNNSL